MTPRVRRTLSPRVILALGFVIPFLYGYPGVMSQDGFDMLVEARANVFTDANPPLLTWLWRVTDMIVPGQFLMFVAQQASILGGLFLVLRRTALAPRAAAAAAGALFVFPPILVTTNMVWKDNLMAGMLLLGAGMLLSPRRSVRLASLLALFVATAVRYNGAAAVLPLVVLLFEYTPGSLAGVRRYSLSVAMWIGVTVVAFGLNAKITDRSLHLWASTLAIHDIAGTIANLDGELTDAEMEVLLAGTEPEIHTRIHAAIRARYSPRTFFPLTNLDREPMWKLPMYGDGVADARQRAAIGALWKKLVVEHPAEWAKHRYAVMKRVLAVGHRPRDISAIANRLAHIDWIAKSIGLDTSWSSAQRGIGDVLTGIWKHVPIYHPFIYLVLALVALGLRPHRRDTLALLLSGLALEGSLLVFAHTEDYRYSHWMITATAVALVILIVRRARGYERVAPITQHASASQASTQ